MNVGVLKKLGLDEKEIKVYLALLRLGSVTASKISKETDIDRATCYRYLDSLINKGLVSYVIENNVKFFSGAHPDKILKDLKEKQSDYKKILPDLVGLMKEPKEEMNVEVFKGKEGLKTVLREILREKKDHWVLGDEGHYQDLMGIFFEQFIAECARLKLKERVLCSESVREKLKKFDYKYSETRSLSGGVIFPTTTLITDEKIILFNWVEPYNAVVISSKDMAKAYAGYFEMLWKLGKK